MGRGGAYAVGCFLFFPKLKFVKRDVIILSVENIFAAAQRTTTVKTLM